MDRPPRRSRAYERLLVQRLPTRFASAVPIQGDGRQGCTPACIVPRASAVPILGAGLRSDGAWNSLCWYRPARTRGWMTGRGSSAPQKAQSSPPRVLGGGCQEGGRRQDDGPIKAAPGSGAETRAIRVSRQADELTVPTAVGAVARILHRGGDGAGVKAPARSRTAPGVGLSQ